MRGFEFRGDWAVVSVYKRKKADFFCSHFSFSPDLNLFSFLRRVKMKNGWNYLGLTTHIWKGMLAHLSFASCIQCILDTLRLAIYLWPRKVKIHFVFININTKTLKLNTTSCTHRMLIDLINDVPSLLSIYLKSHAFNRFQRNFLLHQPHEKRSSSTRCEKNRVNKFRNKQKRSDFSP